VLSLAWRVHRAACRGKETVLCSDTQLTNLPEGLEPGTQVRGADTGAQWD
jgi:hypothetical protein